MLGVGLLLSVVAGGLAKDLPSILPRCYIDDPKINDCILNATKTLKPHMQKGIKDIRLPSFSPLVTEFGMSQEDSPLINYTIYFWNFTMQGVNDYKFQEIRLDPKTMNVQGRIHFPPVPTHSHCEVSGDYLNIHTHTKGPVEGHFGETDLSFEITGEQTKRKSKNYFEPKQVKVTMVIEDFKVNVTNLFGENRALGLVVNELVDFNSKLIIDTITPTFAKVIESMWMRHLKWLTNKYPITVLFPHSSLRQ